MWVHTGARARGARHDYDHDQSAVALALYAPFVLFFTQLHILAVFIILGVGADDIFAWSTAAVGADDWPKTDDAHGRRAVLVRRMTFTYRRTASAVFNTSFTTATAFFGTAVSPVMPIAAFGVFAALAIVMNYVLVCTWWPAAVLVHEIWFGRARGCGCCCPCVPQLKVEDGCGAMIGLGCSDPKKKTVETAATKKAAVDDDAAPSRASVGRSGSSTHYSRWMWAPPSLKGAAGGAFDDLAQRRRRPPPRGARRDFEAPPSRRSSSSITCSPAWHLMRDQFLTGSEDQYERGKLYVTGPPPAARIHPMEARQEPRRCRLGRPVRPLGARGAARLPRYAKSPHRAVRRAGARPPLTLVAGYRRMLHGVVCQPPGGAAQFLSATPRPRQRWLDGDGDSVPGDGAQYRRDVGFVDGRLRYARVSYELTMLRSQPSAVVAEVHGKFVEFVEDFFEDAPRALGTAASGGRRRTRRPLCGW